MQKHFTRHDTTSNAVCIPAARAPPPSPATAPRGGGRPGENVSDITVLVAKMAAENGAAFPCRSVGGAEFTLHVQESYQPKPPETELAPFIVAHAAVLYDLLRTVTQRVLQLPDSMPIRLVYMTTIRADTAVAGKGSDGALYFNLAYGGRGRGKGGRTFVKGRETPVSVRPRDAAAVHIPGWRFSPVWYEKPPSSYHF